MGHVTKGTKPVMETFCILDCVELCVGCPFDAQYEQVDAGELTEQTTSTSKVGIHCSVNSGLMPISDNLLIHLFIPGACTPASCKGHCTPDVLHRAASKNSKPLL